MTRSSLFQNITARLTHPTLLLPITLLVILYILFSNNQRLASSLPQSPVSPSEPAFNILVSDNFIDIDTITKMNLFGYVTHETPATRSDEDLPETNLRLVLRGTFANSVKAKASALIAANSDSPAELFFIDDKLPGGARLDKVLASYVVIRRNGQLEKIQFLRSLPSNNINSVTSNNTRDPVAPLQYKLSTDLSNFAEEEEFIQPSQPDYVISEQAVNNSNALAEVRERIREHSQQ